MLARKRARLQPNEEISYAVCVCVADGPVKVAQPASPIAIWPDLCTACQVFEVLCGEEKWWLHSQMKRPYVPIQMFFL